jgi:hypothetical protein
VTTADFIAITNARLKSEARLMARKPKIMADPPPYKHIAAGTIHDTLANHPELISEAWVQRVLDMYQEALQNRVL